LNFSLKAGSRIKIMDIKEKKAVEAAIIHVCDGCFTLRLGEELRLNVGERVKIEAPRREEGLYLLEAAVLERGENNIYCLQPLGEAKLLQRRRAERIPANQPTEFVLLSEKGKDRDFHEGLILDISRTGALLASKEPLNLHSELFLIFELNLQSLPGEKFVPTGIAGKVVREHHPREISCLRWRYCYGVEFDRPFAAMSC